MPYALINVDDDCRRLITEFVEADEQWGNQFIEGQVGERILPHLAETFAIIHTTVEYDTSLNA